MAETSFHDYHELAIRGWPSAEWIDGEGRYASVAPCGVLTVTLHETLEFAQASKSFIDRLGCGGSCRRSGHQIVDLDSSGVEELSSIRPADVPLNPNAVPLSSFSEDYQRHIADIVTLPRPPAKWRSYGPSESPRPIAQLVSRDWCEWYWARGINPDTKRRTLSASARQAIIDRDGLTCGICGGDVLREDVHIDHIVPVVQGGSDFPGNLQVTHALCNMRKGGRI